MIPVSCQCGGTYDADVGGHPCPACVLKERLRFQGEIRTLEYRVDTLTEDRRRAEVREKESNEERDRWFKKYEDICDKEARIAELLRDLLAATAPDATRDAAYINELRAAAEKALA